MANDYSSEFFIADSNLHPFFLPFDTRNVDRSDCMNFFVTLFSIDSNNRHSGFSPGFMYKF
jgi:hypothetical protein